jgi:hypothetical protein
MGGVGSSARRGEWGAGGRERWAVRGARERGRGGLGPESAQPGGGRREIPFSFSFPISKSILLSLFL